MQTSATRRYGFEDSRTYLIATAFIAGNIILPQLCHLLPQGGPTWLPIYFFTLVGAWTYGWRTGVLTALASPLFSTLLTGMPMAASLPAIMLKSILLAFAASAVARRTAAATLGAVAFVILAYQSAGTLGEWAIANLFPSLGQDTSFHAAVQDFRIGLPGMLLQLFGGTLAIRLLQRR
ncbi:MAG: ECF transporter S component [Muribaculaceae bacterium]|nr:ECF transporter S component [Muribaculaceae bacterium]MDE6629449.1 ECF transporter S component [Muribaculaceae bacterium]